MSKLRDAYREKLAARVDELSARLAVARAQARGLTADGKIAAYEELAASEKKLKELKSRLAKLRRAGDSAFKEMKAGMDDAWAELNSAARRAMKQFEAKPSRARK